MGVEKIKMETVTDFLQRGGSVEICPAPKEAGLKRSRLHMQNYMKGGMLAARSSINLPRFKKLFNTRVVELTKGFTPDAFTKEQVHNAYSSFKHGQGLDETIWEAIAEVKCEGEALCLTE